MSTSVPQFLTIRSYIFAAKVPVHLCILRPLKKCMTDEAIKILTEAFISSRLTAVYTVLRCRRVTPEPSAISQERRCSSRYRFSTTGTHNTCPAAAPLHDSQFISVLCASWRRGTLVYRSNAETAPAYLSDEVTLHHLLECALCVQLTPGHDCVPRRAYNGYGVGCFATAGPRLWKSLPLQLREPDISFTVLKLC